MVCPQNIIDIKQIIMALFLDSYFLHLQAATGAERFVIVRDDALRVSDHTTEFSFPATPVRSQGKCMKSGPKFQPENVEFKLPSLPTRIDSQDDLRKPSLKRSLHQRKMATPESPSRFKSLFGAEIASSMISKSLSLTKDNRGEVKTLASLSAPKFPIRKGSRDDLSTLQSRRRLPHYSSPCGAANQKIELAKFLDEVTNFIGETSNFTEHPSRGRDSGEAPYGAKEIQNYSLSPRSNRWTAKPAIDCNELLLVDDTLKLIPF